MPTASVRVLSLMRIYGQKNDFDYVMRQFVHTVVVLLLAGDGPDSFTPINESLKFPILEYKDSLGRGDIGIVYFLSTLATELESKFIELEIEERAITESIDVDTVMVYRHYLIKFSAQFEQSVQLRKASVNSLNL